MTTVSAVVLTMGTRPEELSRGLNSLLAQKGVDLEILCVGNGWTPVNLPAGVDRLTLETNIGACAGRNAGANATSGDLILFFDDDAWLTDNDFVRHAVAAFEQFPDLGMLQPRVHDPLSNGDPRHWIPRIHKGSVHESSAAFSLWEGCLLVRRDAFELAGGWADELFYYHEGIELAWRCWDVGYKAWYGANLEAHHPADPPTRHAMFYRMNGRNRVWVARRALPLPFIPIYVAIWSANDLRLLRDNPDGLAAWFDGWKEGWTQSPGTRQKLKWSTIRQMTLRGRPPIV